MRKKIFGMLLFACVLFSIIPMATMANEDTQTAPTYSYEELYVQDGLVMLFDAFDATDVSKINMQTGFWYNQADGASNFAKLNKPTFKKNDVPLPVWEMGPNGGVGYDLSVEQWMTYGQEIGIDLGAYTGGLPSEDYTVEMVLQPLGISENGKRTNEQFTAEQLVNVGGFTYPTSWVANGDAGRFAAFGFGPFKGMAFKTSTGRTMWEKRADATELSIDFLYMGLHTYGTPPTTTDAFWGSRNAISINTFKQALYDVDGDMVNESVRVTSMSVTHDFSEPHSDFDFNNAIYTVYNPGSTYSATSVATNHADIAIFNNYDPANRAYNNYGQVYYPSTDSKFSALAGFAGNMFTIRVYDRVLTTAEIQQNHIGDLVLYYGLDLEFYNIAKSCVEDRDAFYAMFDGMDFTLTNQEAQEYFDSMATKICLQSTGFSVRYDDVVGVRAEFEANPTTVANLVAKGYTVEYGALLNYGEEAYPRMDDYAYKIVAREANGTINNNFYIDGSDTDFAFTVLFNNPDQAMTIASMRFSGYMSLTDPDGNVQSFCIDAKIPDSDMTSLLTIYDTKMDDPVIYQNAFIRDILKRAYTVIDIYVDVNGDDAGDGSEESPFATIAKAYEKIYEILASATPVDVTLNLGAGVHRLTEAQILDANEITQKYFKFNILGEALDSVVTSNKELDASDFTKVAGKDYYMYQFPQNGDGMYDDFKFLYVNGRIATPAHNGDTRVYGGTPLVLPFNPIFDKTSPDFGKLYIHSTLLEGVTVEDLQDMEIHVQVQWEYKIMHLESFDLTDTVVDGDTTYVAVFLNSEEMATYNGNATLNDDWAAHYYWLENTLGFVDEAGEYYYNSRTGQLFYYPATDVTMAEATFEIPTTKQLFHFIDVNDLKIDGVTFTGTDHTKTLDGALMAQQGGNMAGTIQFGDYAALYIIRGESISIENNLFTQLGGDAIQTAGDVDDISIYGNEFDTIGASAIRHLNTIRDAYISDNYLHHTAFFVRCAPTLMMQFGEYVEIIGNTIHDTSYTAISVGWKWNAADWKFGEGLNLYEVLIAYNYIFNYMTDMGDGGAIYTLGGNVKTTHTDYFNYILDNVVVAVNSGNKKHSHMPYYHDGASSNWLDEGNVLFLDPNMAVHTPYYIQNIGGQESWNIHLEENFTVYAEMDEHHVPEYNWEQNVLNRVYGYAWVYNYQEFRVDPARNITQNKTFVLESYEELEDYRRAMTTIEYAGSSFYFCDFAEITDMYDNMLG